VGTIFSFYSRPASGPCADCEGELRAGAEIVAAGYVLYGPSTVFVYSIGDGSSGFTLDHDVGEFILSHAAIECPRRGSFYSANLGRYNSWHPHVRSFADYVIQDDPASGRPYSLRYTGALVADLHRSLLEGGIYFYPGDASNPDGKLRLLYECAPLAFITEQAGGRASTGDRRILEVAPESLHQKAPFAVGSLDDVQLYERFFAKGTD
jgi:fructose-1,6-bisphosphatase I